MALRRRVAKAGTVRPAAGLAAAASLLTRVPVAADGERSGAWAFGLVGAALGLGAAAPLLLASWLGSLPSAVLSVAVLAAGSGALHLDGLADTADALAAPTPEAAERARRDPRAGAAGVVAIVVALGLDAALLAEIVERASIVAGVTVAVAATAASRASAALVPTLAAGRVREGLGRWFSERTAFWMGAAAAASAVALALALTALVRHPAPAVAAFAALGSGALAAVVLVRHRDGLDGDSIGATVELAFTGALLGATVTI